ncbi:nuclear transport factor 2 family protein [Achromobacter aloeverae]|uniref:Polyketide cyclase n=1 Tax=Achromobacter aloeverae TaxID=1750518 RepID=A0A4V1MS51_9BURK|nr:nuclear transport factor 2 family protein [Achromobacter aloeverae]RXN90092.1 polyketide cyclase [Achromobacter aloeverae]
MKLQSIVAGTVLAVGLLGGANAANGSSKEVVLAYYRMMFQDKDVEQAMSTYVNKNLIQHDPYLGDGAAAMTDFFVPYYEQHPQASAEIKRVVSEGDIVVVHALWKETPEDVGQAVVDIFRVENSKIVEHWNVSQDIPDNPANKNTMF